MTKNEALILHLKSQLEMKGKIIDRLKLKIESFGKNEMKANNFRETLGVIKMEMKEKDLALSLISANQREKDFFTEELKNQVFSLNNQLRKSEENEKIMVNDLKTLFFENENLKTKFKISQTDFIVNEASSRMIKSLSTDRVHIFTERAEQNENIVVTLVHCFAELFLKIYTLFEKNLNKNIHKHQEYYFQNISKDPCN
jgi:hypothetical protein